MKQQLIRLIGIGLLLSGVFATAYAQDEDEVRYRPTADQFSATGSGVLQQIRWNEQELVIDGKTYRFDSETLAVFYLNHEWSLVNMVANALISYQVINGDRVVAIWVKNSRGIIKG
ncbi:MAG: hypothetical protein Tsb002_21760 [Wenzhouxiangellaceae bacterium]